jgi:hypothetical protein
MGISMGIGVVGAPDVIIKRKFRYTLKIDTPCGEVPEHFIKSAARPKLQIEPTEINFLHATTWIPGKAKWEPITVTYIDVASDEMEPLLSWLMTIYNFQDSIEMSMSEKSGWSSDAIITMYDGCGQEIERWVLKSVWPESVDFGSLENASSEEATIELVLRYSEVKYESLCGRQPEACPCEGCDSTASAGTSGLVGQLV